MKFAHAVRVFDSVEPSLPGYEDVPGRVSCCGVSVVINSQNGTREVYCPVCHTRIIEGKHGDWFIRVERGSLPVRAGAL